MTMRRFRTPSGELRAPLEATLKLHGIEWAYFTHEGQLALGYQKFAIHWEPALKQYVFKESGEVVFSDVEMAKCLDMAPGIIFDSFASQIANPFEPETVKGN